MIVQFQYPIIDFRFSSLESKRLEKPFCVLENIDAERNGLYLKRNGTYRLPQQEPYEKLRPEIPFFEADSSLKIDDLTHESIGWVCIQGRGRRFYLNQDNTFLSVFELNFEDISSLTYLTNGNLADYGIKLSKIIAHYEGLPLFVNKRVKPNTDLKQEKPNPTTVKVGELGHEIKRLYLESTTESKCAVSLKGVEVCQGIAVFEMEVCNIDFELEKNSRIWELVGSYSSGVKLYHIKNNRNLAVWLIVTDKSTEGYDADFVRDLRLNVLRIHQEKEAIKKVIAYIKKNESYLKVDVDAKKKIEKYLDVLTNKILKDIRYRNHQSDMLSASLDDEIARNARELENIVEGLNLDNPWILPRIVMLYVNINVIKNGILYLVDKSNLDLKEKQEIRDAFDTNNKKYIINRLKEFAIVLLEVIVALSLSNDSKFIKVLPLIKYVLTIILGGK